MSFQLRRMVLVNAGTNKSKPSGRITEIDPRGGAAVVGANGVGKTSTLRLIPLFFGHPTSQVVAMNQGQEGVRFILPSLTSAICFEYQRGSDAPENLRLAVMRQRPDADAPEYRIFPCGFRQELFVRDGHFVTDDVTSSIALQHGLAPTSKLNTSEYRSVILGSRSLSKDHKKLLAYSRQHSFGPRELPNLDKLVATMVKNKVSFPDLVQVAVGLIEIERGGDHRQRLTFRQQRKQLEDWLRNLDAAKAAVAAEPRITRLSGMCHDFNATEREWRRMHHEVLVVAEAREQLKEQQDADLASLDAARQTAVDAERTELSRLEGEAATRSSEAARIKAEYESAKGKKQFFESERAEHWAQRMEELPSLQANRGNLEAQLALALAGAQQAQASYSSQAERIRSSTSKSRIELENRKPALHTSFDEERKRIAEAESRELKELASETAGKASRTNQLIGPLNQSIGEFRLRAENPPVPADLQLAHKQAVQRKENNAGEIRRHIAVVRGTLQAQNDARQTFERSEQQLAAARRRVQEAEAARDRAMSRLNPADGTLLSALRAHPGDHWKKDLARVIDPALLSRHDLGPVSPAADSADAAESLYGWQIDTSQIDAPDWTDDARLREAVNEAAAEVTAAVQAESQARDEVARASEALQDAEEAHRNADAEQSVLAARDDELRGQVEEAWERIQAALSQARQAAQLQLATAQGELSRLQKELQTLEKQADEQRSAIVRAHAERIRTAEQRRNKGLEAIGTSIDQLEADAAQRLTELEQQLHEQLRGKGIDPEALKDLETQINDLDKDVRALVSRQPLVSEWRLWLDQGGESRVATLESRARRTAAASTEAATAVENHREAIRKADKAHTDARALLTNSLAQLETDIRTLSALPELFGDYRATAFEGIDLTQPSRELKQKVHAKQEEMRKAARDIETTFAHLHKDLTARESTTRELIEGHLAAAGDSIYLRATALLSAYRRLGTQVIPDLRNTLQTVLANIGSFHKSIRSFESEVGTFNARLQEALKDVKRFERVEELHLNIVADFESLHFYKKLRHMDDVVRQHQASGTDVASLPPEETAEALRDFLGVMGADGTLEVNLGAHISLHGSVIENGKPKTFKRPEELESISSTGLTHLIQITLLIGLVNTVRRGDDVHVPWVTDEVGQFDPQNFSALLQMLADNRIDVVTASPALDLSQFSQFGHCYVFEDNGVIKVYSDQRGPRLELAA